MARSSRRNKARRSLKETLSRVPLVVGKKAAAIVTKDSLEREKVINIFFKRRDDRDDASAAKRTPYGRRLVDMDLVQIYLVEIAKLKSHPTERIKSKSDPFLTIASCLISIYSQTPAQS